MNMVQGFKRVSLVISVLIGIFLAGVGIGILIDGKSQLGVALVLGGAVVPIILHMTACWLIDGFTTSTTTE